MKTTTIKIATTAFVAAVKAGATGIVSVISSLDSSRRSWRYVVGDGNPGVVRQRHAWLAGYLLLAMRHAAPALAMSCRSPREACGGRPSFTVARRQLVVS
ncbi:MAG: hypothetical protein AAF266_05990 [Planctomycetota bacterium]